MKISASILFVFIFAFSAFGQSEKAKLNSWRGLVLDETSAEKAIEILGQPAKDSPKETFRPIVYSKWFGNDLLKFRRLTFKKLEGFDSANLYFSDNKLVVIELDMKKDLSAAALVDAYENKFYPMVGNYENGLTPNDLMEGKREIIYPKYFPAAYNMAAATDKAIGMAYASQGFGENLVGALANPNAPRGAAIGGALAGLVRKIQLISRKLENTKGTDLLK